MLMIWIIGFGAKTQEDLGAVLAARCPRCHNLVDYHLLHVRFWFTLFFIRIFPYRDEHHLICPICSNGVELKRESQVTQARRLVKATRAFRRQKISEERYHRILGKALGKGPFRQLTVKE